MEQLPVLTPTTMAVGVPLDAAVDMGFLAVVVHQHVTEPAAAAGLDPHLLVLV